MHPRQAHRFFKILTFSFLYAITYLLISFILTQPPIYNFVSDDLRIGDKYVLIYLAAKVPALSDSEGADIFRSRQCDYCFITNNKGFMPITEYDAIIDAGDKAWLESGLAFMDPGKLFVIEASGQCLQKKLLECDSEPVLISFASKDSFSLCQLCRHLHENRRPGSGFAIRRKLTDHEKCVHPVG